MSDVIQVRRPQDDAPTDKGLWGSGVSKKEAATAAGIIAGAIAGYFTAGAAAAPVATAVGGAISGAATGGAVGSTAGALIDKPKIPGAPGAQAAPMSSQSQSSAITRRLNNIAAENGDDANYRTLVAAENASASLPEVQRQQYMPTLTQARMLEEQRLKQYYG
jgi:outer membrane lipoprotein SlyB